MAVNSYEIKDINQLRFEVAVQMKYGMVRKKKNYSLKYLFRLLRTHPNELLERNDYNNKFELTMGKQ